MTVIQMIRVDDELAGVVVDDRFLMRDGLTPLQARTAQAMALFAIDVNLGTIPGVYSDQQARLVAHQAGVRRALADGGPRE